MSRWPRAGRVLLWLSLLVGWLSLSLHVLKNPAPRPLFDTIALAPWTTPAGWALLSATVFIGGLLFALGGRAQNAGWLCVAALFFGGIIERHSSAHPDQLRHQAVMPAAMLGTFLLVRALRRGKPDAEAAAHEAACGVVGASYALAGISKLMADGWVWLRGDQLAIIIVERSVGAGPLLSALRRLVAHSPTLCTVLATSTVCIELGALTLISPHWRRDAALVLWVFHIGVALLLGFVYLGWMLLLLGVACSTLALPSGTAPPSPP